MCTVMVKCVCVLCEFAALWGCDFLSDESVFTDGFSGSERPATDVLNPVRRQSCTPTQCFPQAPVFPLRISQKRTRWLFCPCVVGALK